MLLKSVRTLSSLLCAWLQREPERRRIDVEQHVAGGDVLALLHRDASDLAGNVGRDQHLLGPDIGVVGGDVAAARQIEDEPADEREQRERRRAE